MFLKIAPALVIYMFCLFVPVQAQIVVKPFQITQSESSVRIDWSQPASMRKSTGWATDDLVVVRMPGQAAVVPQVLRIESVPWNGHRAAPAPISPQTLDGRSRAELAPISATTLPQAPLRVVRDSLVNGVRLVVLAITPYYDMGNGPQELTLLQADLPNAIRYDGDATSLFAQPLPTPQAIIAPPTSPVVGTPLVRIRVDHEGLQRITGASLTAAGVNLATLTPTMLRLFHGGQEVALELVGTNDGSFEAADQLRFFAGTPGDRWNASDTYWLATGTTAGLRFGSRATASRIAPISTTALQQATWREAHVYDTTIAGPVGDYWYAADLKTDPTGPSEVSFTVTLTPTLALGPGPLNLTIDGAAYTSAARTLIVRGNGVSQAQTWSGLDAWTQSFVLPANPGTIELALQRGTAPAGIEIQRIRFSRSVDLDLAGRGALFTSLPTLANYQIRASAAGRRIYDVTDPGLPVLLTVPDGSDFILFDAINRRYLVSGLGVEFEPTVTQAALIDVTMPLNSQAVYIAPQLFQSALTSLLEHRRAQGYSTVFVDVQAIYDWWSAGQVDPRAIRNFLRYARSSWATPPVAVTLIGDGTADPLNYVRRNNTNFIPPFLAHVDPYIGETACETCYAQLDGVEPLSDSLPDIALGRLPVKSVTELQTVVRKLIAYETATIAPDWQSRVLFVADNYLEADGNPDNAGNFAQQSDTLAAMLPQGVEARKLYYDPSPTRPNNAWREADALRARNQVLRLFGEGAAIVTYIGHASQFQWAVTDPSVEPSSLLGLYDPDALTNLGRPAIVRELTCLTAAFHTPAFSGTSIDERLILAPGGAVAVWGSSGLGVLHGHDLLAQGFDHALWQTDASQPTIGRLALAGYVELYTKGSCCQDAIWTYMVLGDPLTIVRIMPAQRSFLPLVVR